MDKDEQEYPEHQAWCGRCIQDWFDECGKEHKGTKAPADCEECGVCSECEHWSECSKAN